MFDPYHGQYANGLHFKTRSPNVYHLGGSSSFPWFRFVWSKPSGVYDVATLYSLSAPYWFFICLYASVVMVARSIRRQRDEPAQQRATAESGIVPDRLEL